MIVTGVSGAIRPGRLTMRRAMRMCRVGFMGALRRLPFAKSAIPSRMRIPVWMMMVDPRVRRKVLVLGNHETAVMKARAPGQLAADYAISRDGKVNGR
jgi:hypothetical protein